MEINKSELIQDQSINKKWSKLAIFSFILNILSIYIILDAAIIKSFITTQFTWNIPQSLYFIILFSPLVSLIISIVSLFLIKKYNLRGKIIAWMPIVIIALLIISFLFNDPIGLDLP